MKRKGLFIVLVIISTVMLAGCAKESIYDNKLITDTNVVRVSEDNRGYYVTFLMNGQEFTFALTGDNPGHTKDEINNYLKSSSFNGIEPKFNLIVDADKEEVRGISITEPKN